MGRLQTDLALTLIAVMSWVVPAAVTAQVDLEHRGDAVAWQYDLGGEPGVIRGVVLNEDGTPVEGLQIAVSGQGGALTDAQGRFEIRGIPPGDVVLKFEYLGLYPPVSQELVVPTDAAVWVSAVVTLAGIGGRCGDLVMRGDGIFAEVRDSVTGDLPSVPVTLRLEQADSAWETTRTLQRSQFGGTPILSLSHRVEVVGRFSIRVSAPGYEDWQLNDIELQPEYAVCSSTAPGRWYLVRLRPQGLRSNEGATPKDAA